MADLPNQLYQTAEVVEPIKVYNIILFIFVTTCDVLELEWQNNYTVTLRTNEPSRMAETGNFIMVLKDSHILKMDSKKCTYKKHLVTIWPILC